VRPRPRERRCEESASARKPASASVSGESKPVTKITASAWGKNCLVVAVLISMADPTPGVSANSNPSSKISAGISTWTDTTCSSARLVLASAT
jgi:hypothetical protein